jgi:hypothetical protein
MGVGEGGVGPGGGGGGSIAIREKKGEWDENSNTKRGRSFFAAVLFGSIPLPELSRLDLPVLASRGGRRGVEPNHMTEKIIRFFLFYCEISFNRQPPDLPKDSFQCALKLLQCSKRSKSVYCTFYFTEQRTIMV